MKKDRKNTYGKWSRNKKAVVSSKKHDEPEKAFLDIFSLVGSYFDYVIYLQQGSPLRRVCEIIL